MSDLELHPDERLAMAFREAVTQSNRSAHVTIHVGQQVAHWMRERNAVEGPTGPLLWHGFPVAVHPAWATEEIEVSSSVRIP